VKEFKATAVIQRPAADIWPILTNTGAYPEWDPFCDKIDGTVALGAKLKAFSKLSPGRGFKVKVTELAENQRMTWSGGMPFGLFKGVRTFTLEETAPGTTTFTLHEVFSGPMLRMIGKHLPDMTDAFEQFATGL
jgi:hypothetical protein